ncbi:hypothetical protein, partial [Lentzea sp. NPDC004782]|uniref:hypothetical protein n=1 Tax=Lentzea sp. NPDC004782 TaxID=3154458 RepID=UPI0033A3DD15
VQGPTRRDRVNQSQQKTLVRQGIQTRMKKVHCSATTTPTFRPMPDHAPLFTPVPLETLGRSAAQGNFDAIDSNPKRVSAVSHGYPSAKASELRFPAGQPHRATLERIDIDATRI